MKKIASFTIDHLTLLPGVYVSRKDTTPSGDVITTFDVRMTAPNRQPAISIPALHAMEHLAATFLRNHPEWGDRIVYWGPMGCCTGNYLLLNGDYESSDIVPLIKETFRFVADFEGEVPGATPKDCGNYLLMNLPEAKMAARDYLKILDDPNLKVKY
ncbi:MAG: S-ribosylhomocysteine lyase [Muribaculaceae bacterium]|nr:S-ribosylhomocysteine lyase [Muribaculaceae bacterium]MDE6523284.1 S-ribosylhomocysteine lyase [Muribaculaceae bacterium]